MCWILWNTDFNSLVIKKKYIAAPLAKISFSMITREIKSIFHQMQQISSISIQLHNNNIQNNFDIIENDRMLIDFFLTSFSPK